MPVRYHYAGQVSFVYFLYLRTCIAALEVSNCTGAPKIQKLKIACSSEVKIYSGGFKTPIVT